jgi:thioredoxin 1
MQTALIVSAILVAIFTVLFLIARARIRNIPLVEDHERIITLTDRNFQHQTKNRIVLVDFWTAWCVPCTKISGKEYSDDDTF